MQSSKTITVLLPAYMEAENIRAAVSDGIAAIQAAGFITYEIIIIDCLRKDGADDGTPRIADELVQEFPHVRVLHNKRYVNLGEKYWQGVQEARHEYITWIPGDNENDAASVTETLRHIGEADIIIPYPVNTEVRSPFRRFLSTRYTAIYNMAFGLSLHYYNGLAVYKRSMLLKLPQWTDSFAFAAEILVLLLKSGASYTEVPIRLRGRTAGQASAFKLKNIIGVMKVFLNLLWRVHIQRERVSFTETLP